MWVGITELQSMTAWLLWWPSPLPPCLLSQRGKSKSASQHFASSWEQRNHPQRIHVQVIDGRVYKFCEKSLDFHGWIYQNLILTVWNASTLKTDFRQFPGWRSSSSVVYVDCPAGDTRGMWWFVTSAAGTDLTTGGLHLEAIRSLDISVAEQNVLVDVREAGLTRDFWVFCFPLLMGAYCRPES